LAAEKGIPLEQAVRAFADERPLALGGRAARLAAQLEAGTPLPVALARSQNPLSTDALLASRVGVQTGQLGPALRMALDHSDQLATIMRRLMAKYCYLLTLLCLGLYFVTYAIVRIIPRLSGCSRTIT